ncbi:hypothetical protein [Flammeovirga kamogawensis]|uniref:Uncharacterized protein n=1 Tax=Flammeovirga kamogawensis TaxID=373891 RepID=A0ABX8GR05_9BACT|nr:hypothetical protein [Flammeovirga kamogawensis]MBB6463060.1 hypothetical protein [Flammeovirga kamogawensis]QWG05697.1 hypothetical protein KM029_09905 [Flammeovirga kamogawensis]TRX67525.1 hypothetical protein EO216_04935 [Flammeovirga kamogawensis]
MEKVQIEQTLKKIIESEVFVSSFRAKALLNYLISKYYDGEESDFSSYTIALEVFDREEHFDPSLDPIVRVQIGRLRVLLSKFYLQEGTKEDAVITIPRGSYKPRISEKVTDLKAKKTVLPTGTAYEFPKLHISPLYSFENNEEKQSNYFKEVLSSRFLRTNFFKVTDALDADFYVSTFKNKNELGLIIKDRNQHGILEKSFPITKELSNLNDLIVFTQLLIDGPYGLLEKEIDQVESLKWISTFIAFEEIVLEKGWMEFIGELITKLEKVLGQTKSSFVASILIKYYHIDYQYNVLNFPNGLEKAEELFKLYNLETADFLAEKIWSEIYKGKQENAQKLFEKLLAIEGKHYETEIQELLLLGYFGDTKGFMQKKEQVMSVTDKLPSACISFEAFLALLRKEEVSDELLKRLEDHLYFFNLFLLSKLSKTKTQRARFKTILEESTPSFIEHPQKLLSLWCHPTYVTQII